MSWDASELADLGQALAGVNVARTVRPVMSKAGLEMKRGAQRDAPSGPHLPGYRRTMNYELKDKGLAVEMAPREEGQGLLSAALEYGQGRNAPHPHIIPQLDKEAPTAEKYLATAIADAIVKGAKGSRA